MELPLLLITVLFLFFILRVFTLGPWSISRPNYSRRNLPPGPWKLPIIGSLHHLVGSLPHRTLRNLARKYGPLMHLQLGDVSTVVVSSPEIAKEIMQTHGLNFAYRPELLALKILTYGCKDVAFSPYGEYWRQLLKICTVELLSAKRVQSFQWIREEETSNLIQWIGSNARTPINMTQCLFSMAYSMISRAAFGKKCGGQMRFMEVIREINVLARGFEIADIFPSRTFLQSISRTRSKLEKLHLENDDIMESIINEHRQHRAAGEKTMHEDLIDVLLNFEKQDDQGFSLGMSNMKAVIFDVFSAGGESSATTLDWAMAELIKNPSILEKAQTEVRQVFGRRGGMVKEDDLSELKYLKLVIKEVLRFHPALALLLPRESGETCQVNGFEIPKKSRVIINAWAIGRDPDYWNEPETFNPERFLDNQIDYKGNNFEYIPFGAGRRICPGINFVASFVELLLAQLLYHFNWQLPDGMKNEDLDMTESFGVSVQRKQDLFLIPTPYYHENLNKYSNEVDT